nr:PREDICTED: mitochondrial outer membrane protein porin of 36 kDa-like [Nicotiana tabacum]
MSKQPGIYSDIGKDATDLLYGDYNMQPPICYHFNWLDWSLNLSGGVRASVPGQEIRTLLKFYLPYQRSNKVELQYLRDYFGYTAGISLTKSPLISFSGVIGNGFFNTGADISIDAETDILAKCDAGLSFNTDILTASLTLSDKADTLRAHAYRQIQPLTHTGIAAELMHQFSSKQTTLTLGAQHSPFPFMLIKARAASDGSLATLFQHDLLSRFCLTIGAEMNVMDAMSTATLGVSLSLKV